LQRPLTWYPSSRGYHPSHSNPPLGAQLQVPTSDIQDCAGRGHSNRRGLGWRSEM
jgi:hypothetical protein